MRYVAVVALLVACGARSDLSGYGPPDAAPSDVAVDVVPDTTVDTPLFDLTVTPSLLTLVQGGPPASVSVHVTRLGGFTGDVDLALASLPAGVSATAATVTPNQTDATLALTAVAPGPQAAQKASVHGTAVAALPVDKPLSLFIRGCPGCVDTTFSGDGFAEVEHQYGHAIAVDTNGAIVVPGSNWDWQGSFANGVVSRVLANGDLDTSFGVAGQATFAPGVDVFVRQVSTSSAGAIAVGGTTGTSPDALVAKLDGAGKLDPQFGKGGVSTMSGGHCYGVRFLADGTMLSANDVGSPNVVHLLADGSIDASYGTLLLPWSSGSFLGDANIALDASGRALVAGGTNGFNGAVISRIAGDTIDTTFGSSGTVDDTGFIGSAYWVDVGANGLLAAGQASGAVIAKYTTDGARDPSFGSGGLVTYTFATATTTLATASLFQTDGAVLAYGYVVEPPNRFTYLRRFKPSGAPDATFGPGVILFDDGSSDTKDIAPGGMALYPDDRLVVRFNAVEWNAESYVSVLVRLWL